MITAIVCLVVGMFVGSVLVLAMGALMAASRGAELNFEDEYDEINRKYVALLEHQVFGSHDPDTDEDEEDYE